MALRGLLLALGLALVSGPAAGQGAPVDASAARTGTAGAAGTAGSAGSDRAAFARGWLSKQGPLEQRVEATRTAALELGLRNVEPAARALLLDPSREGRLASARAAVRLAPDLPAAHMELAFALWREKHDLPGGVAAAWRAFGALERNLEASLWWRATAWMALALTLIGGAFAFLILSSLGPLRFAAHDLGDPISRRMPAPSRLALLGCLVLAPAALGEGLFGAALGLFALTALYSGRGGRVVAMMAMVALLAGLHPALDHAGRALAALGADPVARAAHAAEHGLASPMELARLERAAEKDPLAARALALGVKRTGDLAEADARYALLVQEEPLDPVVANNAANVRLALGDTAGAIELYEAALDVHELPVLLFNLSQAWGVALRVEELDAALARAQELDPVIVEDLSEIQGRAIHFVADLPVPTAELRARLLQADALGSLAASLRAPLAPGRLGRSPLLGAVAFGAVLVLTSLLGKRYRASVACDQCGVRVCPRCDRSGDGRGSCASCALLYQRAETTDSTLRAERIRRLRDRREWLGRRNVILSLLVPGAVGILYGRPGLGLASILLFAGAVSSFALRHGVAVDPLAAGATGGVAAACAVTLLALLYLLALAFGLARREEA